MSIGAGRVAAAMQLAARVNWRCGCPEHARAWLETKPDPRGWKHEPATACGLMRASFDPPEVT